MRKSAVILVDRMHRFFLTSQIILVNQLVDLTPLAHQLHTVLRLKLGAQILLLDGQGYEFVTEIRSLERHRAAGWPLLQRPVAGEPSVRLTLYQCSLKADKFEWVLQKGTELGVARFVPVISERSVVRPATALTHKYERWQVILREAAEQSGRGRVPELALPVDWRTAIHQEKGVRLLPWEGARMADGRLPLADLLRAAAPHTVSLLIGPEGGITPQETAVAQAAGWQIVSLGARILRAETAALAGIAIVMEHLQQL